MPISEQVDSHQYPQLKKNLFDQTDFSVVVKNRAAPPKPWRWEIYRAGRKNPIECSSVLYETVEVASRVSPQIDDRASGASIPRSSYAWMSDVSLLDAFISVKMGTLREFQLYMVW
jgi:hypothetical protein